MKCKQATRLMSETLDRTLAPLEGFQLKLHLVTCIGCRNYRRQIGFLRSACTALLKQVKEADTPSR